MIMSMTNSNDTIGDRTRAQPQPAAPTAYLHYEQREILIWSAAFHTEFSNVRYIQYIVPKISYLPTRSNEVADQKPKV